MKTKILKSQFGPPQNSLQKPPEERKLSCNPGKTSAWLTSLILLSQIVVVAPPLAQADSKLPQGTISIIKNDDTQSGESSDLSGQSQEPGPGVQPPAESIETTSNPPVFSRPSLDTENSSETTEMTESPESGESTVEEVPHAPANNAPKYYSPVPPYQRRMPAQNADVATSYEDPFLRNQKVSATLQTSLGTIKIELFPIVAPKTVKNFVDLAEGKKEFLDPKTGKMTKRPFYDGLTFHRVIPNYIAQTGCPLGNGKSGPGFKVDDEFHNRYRHDNAGVVSMAHSGANNGSQFFITLAPAPDLNGRHTIFGRVVEGMGVLRKIAKIPRDITDKPLSPIMLEKVTIERQPYERALANDQR